MKTEIRLTEAMGKTLEAVAFSALYYGGKCVLVFSDGTYSTLGIRRGDEPGEEEIEESTISILDFGDDELIRVGIVTADELEEIREESDKESRLRHEAARELIDRAEFERLKLKYGA